MSAIPLDKAYLTAIWLETLFYGINFVFFWACIYVFTFRKKMSDINKTLVFIAISQYLLSTVHVGLGFQRLITGFIQLRDQPGGPATYFSDVSIPLNVAKVFIHTINSIIGDGIVVWRCYLVWGKSWVMAGLPIALVFGSTICGFAQAIYFARATSIHSAFNIDLVHWNGSLFSLSLATNVIGTGLIAFRIWSLLRMSTAFGNPGSKYSRVLALVIESAMIYSMALIVEITLYFLGSNAFYIIYDPIAQLTSIIPTMILLLVGLKMTTNDIQSRIHKSTTVTLTRPSFKPGTVTATRSTGTSVLPTPYDDVDVELSAIKGDSEYGLSDQRSGQLESVQEITRHSEV